MRNIRRTNKHLLFILTGLLCLMGIGYSAFSSNLKISGTSSVSSSWNIEITGVSEPTIEGLAEETHTPTWDRLTASMEADLYQKGDSVSYDVTIENKGTLNATLEDISENIKSKNEAVRITLTGYTKGQVLKAKSSQIVTVKIEYNPEFTGTAEEGSGEVSVTFNYTQYEGGTDISGDTDAPEGKYLVTYNCDYNGGNDTTSILHNQYLTSGSEIDLTPQCTKAGYTFVGWNTDKDATSKLSSLNMGTSNTTLYAIYVKEGKTVTITFNKNGASTQTNSSGTAVSDTTVTRSCTTSTVYNNDDQEATCNITSPTIVGSSNTPTVVGYNTSSSATSSAWNQNTVKAVSEDATYYAITAKDTKTITITFNKNNAYSQTNSSETAITNNTVTRSCVLAATYNGAAQEATCSITSPTIIPKVGYVVIGYNTSSSATTSTWNQNTTKEVSESATYYAITLDKIAPTITMTPSSQSSYVAGDKTVTLTLADAGSGLKANQTINYAWSTSNSVTPTSWSSVTTSNTAGATSTTVNVTASGLTGTYYLWIKAGTLEDVNGNTSSKEISDAFKFDNDDPIVDASASKTSNTITVVATAYALSDISKYEFSIDNGTTWIDNDTSNIYTFTGLKQSTDYTIMVRVTSGVDKQNTTSITTTTPALTSPTYTETLTSTSKNITITYPSGCGDEYICSYSIDDESSITVTEDTTVEFTNVGTITAKVTDGINTATSTYTVTFAAKELNYSNTNSKLNATNVQEALDEIKKKVG